MSAMELTARRLWWMIAFGGFIFTLQISGLKDSKSCKWFHIYTVNANETAALKCPGVKIKGAYAIVHWKKCPLAGDFDDGHGCRWIVGRIREGKTYSEDERLHITSDGTLHINKVHLNDTARYKCSVGNGDNNDPERHFMALFVNDPKPPTNGCPVSHDDSSYVENGTNARGPGINNTGPGNKEIAKKGAANETNRYPVPQNDSSYENGSGSGPGINNTGPGNKETDNTYQRENCSSTGLIIGLAIVSALLLLLLLLFGLFVWKYYPRYLSDQPIQGQEGDDVPMLKL